MTQNQIRYLQALEEARSNKAKEAETNRSNLENERLARERLDYEKYGRSQVGQTIQAVKAIGSDVAEVAIPAANTVVRTITGNDATTNPVTGEAISNPVSPTRDASMVSHTIGNAPGAFDYKGDVAKSKYSSMSRGELEKEALRYQMYRDLTESQLGQLKNALLAKGVDPSTITRLLYNR